jgi:regulator of sigma E protease
MTALHNLVDWTPLGLPAFLFLITVVVFFHELGHFSVARFFRTRVETFSIGFGPAIVSWTDKHNTRWKISWVLLGGFVKFFGDADAASTTDREAVREMSEADRRVAFPFKPLYQRALIVAAGPFANFILAIVIFTFTFLIFGRPVEPPVIGLVYPNSAAEAAGIKAGDTVRAINGQPIHEFGDLPAIISLSAGQDLAIDLERNGRALTVHATPRLTTITDQLGDTVKSFALGINQDRLAVVDQVVPGSLAERSGFRRGDLLQKVNGKSVVGYSQFADAVGNGVGHDIAVTISRGSDRLALHLPASAKLPKSALPRKDNRFDVFGVLSQPYPKSTIVHYGLAGAVGAGFAQTGLIIKGTLITFWQMAAGYSDTSQLGGPVRIAGEAGKVASLGFLALLQLAALMSVSIGLINLFPIPLLDGGHLLYYGFEAVLGRPLGERAQDLGFRLGLAVVLGLMIFVTWNDLARLNLF